MKYLVIDTETTCLKLHHKKLNGNPYSIINSLVAVGLLDHSGGYHDYLIEYEDNPYGQALKSIQQLVDEHESIVLFNAKFDMHWLTRYGISFEGKRIFDVQLVEFILSNQANRSPSLNQTALDYSLEGKLDIVKEEYWDKGIDTEQIPTNILLGYLKQDVLQTHLIFKEQLKSITNKNRSLISVANQDLKVLFEIEKNGMLFNVEQALEEAEEKQKEIDYLTTDLQRAVDFPQFNPDSNDHLSAVLYGATIIVPHKEIVGVYKTGPRAGEVKYGWFQQSYTLPGLVKPLRGSELKKEGFYSTNASTLQSLRGNAHFKKVIKMIIRKAELSKLVGTYLKGIPTLIEDMDWDPGMIHGQLNQCIAITGRLSSSKPNLQNFDKGISYLFATRY